MCLLAILLLSIGWVLLATAVVKLWLMLRAHQRHTETRLRPVVARQAAMFEIADALESPAQRRQKLHAVKEHKRTG